MRSLTLIAACLTPALWAQTCHAGEIADRIQQIRAESSQAYELLGKKDRDSAKKTLGKRNSQLYGLVQAYQNGEIKIQDDKDSIALMHSMELLFEFENAIALAEEFVLRHPQDESAYLTMLRAYHNLNRPLKAAQLIEQIENRFPPPSPVWFFYSEVATKCMTLRMWEPAFHFAERAAARRLDLLKENPAQATLAVRDFRVMVQSARQAQLQQECKEKLNALLVQLDENKNSMATELEQVSFSKLCIAHMLAFDIAYWLGDQQVTPALNEWVEVVSSQLTSTHESKQELVELKRFVSYFKKNQGLLTKEMTEVIRDFSAFLDSISDKDESVASNRDLTRMQLDIQHILEGALYGKPTLAPKLATP